jgi:hypothetical protein
VQSLFNIISELTSLYISCIRIKVLGFETLMNFQLLIGSKIPLSLELSDFRIYFGPCWEDIKIYRFDNFSLSKDLFSIDLLREMKRV